MWKIIIFTIATGGITGQHHEQYISKTQCRKAAKKLKSTEKAKRQQEVQRWKDSKKWEGEYNKANAKQLAQKRRSDDADSRHTTCINDWYRRHPEIKRHSTISMRASNSCRQYDEERSEELGKLLALSDKLYEVRLKFIWALDEPKPSGKPIKGYKCIKVN